jgi:hypothetical protein
MTYYDHEVNRLGTLPAYLKLQNEHGQTRWMTVTPAQIEAIRAILNQDAPIIKIKEVAA